MARPTLYKPEFHPEDLLKRMAEGQIDVEIYADWDICEKTFYNWLNEHEELKKALDRGKPKWEKAWLQKGIKFMNEGNRDAYKYWAQILGVKGGEQYKQNKIQANSTTINVNQMNLLGNKSEAELQEILEGKLHKLNLLGNTIDAQVVDDAKSE